MDFKIKDISETKKEIEVIILSEEMKPYLEKTANDFATNMNIKGFRPGNAPFSIVENSVGKEKLFEEAARKAIEDTYPKIIKENDLFTVASPQVDLIKCAPGNEVVYKAIVYVMPDIKLPDYKSLSKKIVDKEEGEIEIDEKEIDGILKRMQESKAALQKTERTAKEGDAMVIDFKGVFENDNDKKIEEKDFRVDIGSGESGVIDGFEKELIGSKAGDRKEFSLEIPNTISGNNEKEKVNFDVTVVSVMEKNLPEINDEFASSFPNIDNLNQLKEKIKEGSLYEKRAKEREKVKLEVLENIRKETPFEVPEVLVEKELDNMIKNVENQLSQNGKTLDDYLKEIKKTKEELKKGWKEKAMQNVAYAIILHTISKEEGIDVTDEEIEGEVDRHFKISGKNKEEEKEENLNKMRAYIHDVIKNQKVFKALSIDDNK